MCIYSRTSQHKFSIACKESDRYGNVNYHKVMNDVF
jgi:hypothetical protein